MFLFVLATAGIRKGARIFSVILLSNHYAWHASQFWGLGLVGLPCLVKMKRYHSVDSITPYPCIWYLECCPLWFSLVAGMPIPKPSSAASSAGSSSSPCKAKLNVGEVLRLRLRVAKTFFLFVTDRWWCSEILRIFFTPAFLPEHSANTSWRWP